MALINVNKKAYDHGDITLTFLGNQPINFFMIEYGDEQEHQLNHGRGNEPHSYSTGKITYNCKLGLGMDEVVAVQNAAPGRDLKKIKPFDIIVTYLNEDQQLVVDRVTVKFKGAGRKSSSGDMNIQQEFEMLCLGIKYNVPF
jgi:hypothetical protein